MNISLFLSVFAIFAVAYLVIGLLASRRIKTNDDYFLAGRGLGLGFLTFTLIATHLGGGLILGAAKEAYQVGFYGFLYSFGVSLGLIFLGFGFASKLRSFNVSTTVELLETKYRSLTLRRIASVISALSLAGILAGQVVATRDIFLALEVKNEWLFILFWIFMIVYTILGGLRAVVATDIFQVIFIIILFVVLFGSNLLEDLLCGRAGLLTVLNPQNQSYFSGGLMTFSRLFGFFFMPFLFSFIEQDLAQRFFAARNKLIAGFAATFAGLSVILFSIIPVYFGMKAKLLNIAVPAGASPLVVLLEREMGNWVVVLVICGLFAAVISTADSLLCAASSNIAQDFDFSFLSKNKLAISKITTFVIGVGALFVAYFFDNVLELFKHSYELFIACLFVSIFACYFKDKLYKQAAFASILFGLGSYVFCRFWPSQFFPREIITLSVSLVGYLLGLIVAVAFSRQTRWKRLK